MNNPFDFTLRICESIAFVLHGILGLTEPWTGCLRGAFNDNGAMPAWFWPVAGAILWVVAYANFSGNDKAVLAAQAYIAAFHFGASFYHVRLGHHPAAAFPPLLFVVFAFVVATIRIGIWISLLGTGLATIAALALSKVLVTPPASSEQTNLLLDDGATHDSYKTCSRAGCK